MKKNSGDKDDPRGKGRRFTAENTWKKKVGRKEKLSVETKRENH